MLSSILRGIKNLARKTGEPVALISRLTRGDYALLGFKKTNYLGKSTEILPSSSSLVRTALGDKTYISRVHQENRKITHVDTADKNADKTAYILTGCNFQTYAASQLTRSLVTTDQANKPKKAQIISTTNPDIHQLLRYHRNLCLNTKSDLENEIRPGEQIIGGLRLDIFGPYFGGNPTTYLGANREQIYPDNMSFTTAGLEDHRSIREETERHGPRISGHQEIKLAKSSDGQYRTILLNSGSFVNSTIHRGIQKDNLGKDHPMTCFTPGSKLINHTNKRVTELSDGSTIQSLAKATNASADVLCHWLVRSIQAFRGPQKNPLSGLVHWYSDKGVVETTIAEQGLGHRLVNLGMLATATPFDMTTISIHRGPEGEVRHVVLNKRTKPWPANETIIEITGAKGERQLVILDSIIPTAGFWRDLAVGKLCTPIMSESTKIWAVENGQLKEVSEIEVDKTGLISKLISENSQCRFTIEDFVGEDVPISMMLSAAGMNREDSRSRVTVASTTGNFDNEAIIRSHSLQDPLSMEFYFCGRAMRIIVENMEKYIANNYTFWKENPEVRLCWCDAVSKIPTHSQLTDFMVTHKSILEIIIQDPEEKKRLYDSVNWSEQTLKNQNHIQNQPK